MHQGKSFAINDGIPGIGEVEVQDRLTQRTTQDDVIATVGKIIGENAGHEGAHPIARLEGRQIFGDHDVLPAGQRHTWESESNPTAELCPLEVEWCRADVLQFDELEVIR